jgi:CheY-like chemotaxis protein
VDDLLDLTRIARGKVRLHCEAVDAHAALRDVAAMFQRDIDDKPLTLTVALHAKRHHVWADPGRFQLVLLNLVSNAVKFTPANGAITLRTSNENGTIRVEVADTGVGIEPDVLPRLFQPFEQGEQTTTRKFGGLGLGLSIVKSLVEMHHASISVASEGADRGTTFTLRFDTVPPPAAQAPAGTGGAGASGGGGGVAARGVQRILLVEDHPDSRQVLSKLLGGLGYQVTAVGSVREAVEAAEGLDFDLLVSDIGLPDGSGMDVMRQIAPRRGGRTLKGIALSGYGQEEDVRRSRDAGFVTHLTKPVNLQTLYEVIRQVTG